MGNFRGLWRPHSQPNEHPSHSRANIHPNSYFNPDPRAPNLLYLRLCDRARRRIKSLLWNASGHQGHGSVYTDHNGQYRKDGLEAGRYRVAPYDDRYDFVPTCKWVVVPLSRDDVSFVGVPAGPPPGVTLYEHDEYRGMHETFTGDNPDLTDSCIGDNIVTSIKI